MTLQDIEAKMELVLGKDGVERIANVNGWREFEPYDERLIELYNDAIQLMQKGGADKKELMDVNAKFDFNAKGLCKKVSIGTDGAGNPVPFARLFSEVQSVRPEYQPYLSFKLLMFLLAAMKNLELIRIEAGNSREYQTLNVLQA